MWIYLFTLMMCIILSAITYQKVRAYTGVMGLPLSVNHRYKSTFWFVAVWMLLIVGLRAEGIGVDTWNYKNTYIVWGSQGLQMLQGYHWYDEPAYALVIVFFNLLRIPWQMYAIFMAALYMLPIFFLIYEKSNNCFWALSLFILCGLWTYPMSTMRQAAAIGLTVAGFMYEDQHKRIKCVLCLIVAAMFHISALITFVYLILRCIPMNKRKILILSLISAAIVLLGAGPLRGFFLQIMSFAGRDYQANAATGGLLQELFFVLTLIVGWLVAPNEDQEYWKYYKAILLAAVILPIVRIHPALFRLYQYFSVYQIIFVPKLLSRAKGKFVKGIGYMGFLSVYAFLYFTQNLASSLRIVPYRFFWS